MKDKISVMIGSEELETRIKEMAAQIDRDFAGEMVHIIIILKGAVFFATELAKNLTIPTTIDFIKASSYGDGTVSSGEVKITVDTDSSIEGKNTIVIEDIVDTGRTLAALMKMLEKRNPKALKLCALLNKPSRRVIPVKTDYIGFEIEDKFVVGYGLDYAQRYRNLPFIGTVDEIGDESE